VRARINWTYLWGLELTDESFDYSTLSAYAPACHVCAAYYVRRLSSARGITGQVLHGDAHPVPVCVGDKQPRTRLATTYC